MDKSLIYTRTGDDGTTSLVGGTRVAKNSARLEAYGTIDELNSHIGVVIAVGREGSKPLLKLLNKIQHRLFNIGGYLASDGVYTLPCGVDERDIDEMEGFIDRLDNMLPRINQFILPGGSIASAHTQVARTVCRRAERRVLEMRAQGDQVDSLVIRYINRLSDLLFVVARYYNKISGVDEIFWNKDC